MKLTYDILRTELAEKFSCKVAGVNANCGLIKSALLFEPGMALTPECCYVSEAPPPKELTGEKKVLFILCAAVPVETLTETMESYLAFSLPQSISVVMNALVEIFSRFNQWENGLLESLRESAPLENLLQLSLPIFDNPIFLIDSRFYVIASVRPDATPDFVRPMQKVDELWIIHGKDDLIRARDIDEKPYFRHLPKDYPRLFINLSDGEYLLGNLSIQASHRELQASDGYLLTHLAGVVRTALLRSAITVDERRSQLEKMLSDVIAGSAVEPVEFTRRLAEFGVLPGEHFRCLSLKIPKPSEREYVRNFLQHLGTQIPAMYIPTSGDIAAMGMSMTRAEKQGVDVISILEEKLKSYGYKVGLSDTFENLLFLPQYFTQSSYALQKNEAADDGKYVAIFDDYCMDYILDNCPGNLKPSMLWKEGFKRLLDHDINGRADYINTLRVYLDHNLNAQRAAAALHISRNSLLSQLDRINALIGEDLRDPKVRFRYELSLLLYDKTIKE